jgi:hypothetical protein
VERGVTAAFAKQQAAPRIVDLLSARLTIKGRAVARQPFDGERGRQPPDGETPRAKSIRG